MPLSALEPAAVFHFFEAISRIPRESGNEQAISDYIVDFAKSKNLRYVQDAKNNVVIYKPGSKGYENHAPIILQGHLDMVCVKEKDSPHNFLTDPIPLRTADGYISTCGTSLGADNGIAVAMAMALLDSDALTHPPLEVLFTTDEEAGMSGIEAFDAGVLQGRRMINMDSEEEDCLFTGCAGGIRAHFNLPVRREPLTEKTWTCYAVQITGLTGGHSGMEIHQERGSAIRLLGRVLRALDETIALRLLHIDGGLKQNAIPREASANLVFPPESFAAAEAVIRQCQADMTKEFRVSDPGVTITFTPRPCESQPEPLCQASGRKLIAALLLLPCGVQAMSCDIPGLVESSNNMGIIKTADRQITIESLLRSAVDSRCTMMLTQIKALAEILQAEVVTDSGYPAWTYDPDSALRKTALSVYETVFGSTPKVKAVHAGLECGHMAQKIPGIDMLSFGPNMQGVHTTEERLSIASVGRIWQFLLALLAQL